MKKYRNGMIPLLILLLCLATSGLNIANHVPSGLNRQTGQNHYTYQDGGSIQDIEDSFPPKASFSSGGDIPSEATVSNDGDVSDDNTTASSIDVESSEATTGESHAADLVLSANDRNYKLVATVPSNAQLSEDTELKVNQIKANSDQYIGFRDEVREVLTEELAESSHDRIDIDSFMLFDISFTEDGKEVRPAEPVSVGIDLKLKSKELVGLDNAVVVHVDREKGVELLDNYFYPLRMSETCSA